MSSKFQNAVPYLQAFSVQYFFFLLLDNYFMSVQVYLFSFLLVLEVASLSKHTRLNSIEVSTAQANLSTTHNFATAAVSRKKQYEGICGRGPCGC